MIDPSTFIIEISLSASVSVLALLLLKDALFGLLTDLCRGEQRARFWSRFTQLMLIIGPLLGVLILTPDRNASEAVNTAVFRETLKHAVMGAFAALCAVGFVIWRTIPASDHPGGEAAKSLPVSSREKACE